MRAFITGGTGYVGRSVLRAFVQDGWEVGALVRDHLRDDALRWAGATPITGRLEDPSTYRSFAAISDVVVHCAFETPALDTLAVEEMLGALAAQGGERLFIYTSGVWVLGNTHGEVDESASTANPHAWSTWRPPLERNVLAQAALGLMTAVVRPGLVYGATGGLFARYWNEARNEERIHVIGPGDNHLPLVHRDDLAQLYLRIANTRAGGIFHGVEPGCPTQSALARLCAQAVSPAVEVHSVPVADAREALGPVADGLALDQRVVARRSSELGWSPRHEPFVDNARAVYEEWRARTHSGLGIEAPPSL